MWKYLFYTAINSHQDPKEFRLQNFQDFRQGSLSSVTIEGPNQNSVRVYLYAPDQTVEASRGPSCPYPEIGELVYSGHYQLIVDPTTAYPVATPAYKWKQQKIDIGELSFGEGVNLSSFQADSKTDSNGLVYYQPVGCEKNAAFVYGYDFDKNELALFKFKYLDGRIEDSAINFLDKKPTDSFFTSGYYDNGIGRVRNMNWTFDPKQNLFIEKSEWFSP